MGTLYAVAGQRIYIGSAAVEDTDDDLVEADFDGITWIEIKKWAQMGANGDAAALITTPLIDVQRDKKQKGTRNAGQMQNNFAINRLDTGQIALRAAEATDLNWPFKIVGNDAPAAGSAPAASERKFYALVTEAREAGGGPNTAMMLNSTLEINSNIVTKAPTSGSVPVNTVIPAISGIAQQGVVLTAYVGTWTGGVDSYAYQWQNEGVDIGGATSATYTPVAGDVGDNLRVGVRATNAAGTSAFAYSAQTDEVLAP